MVPVEINCTDEGTWIIATNLVDEEYLKNASAVIRTEASYILGVTEGSLQYTLALNTSTSSSKRASNTSSPWAARINFDLAGAYPPNYLIIIIAVSVAVPASIAFLVGWYLFYYRMKMKAKTKDLGHLPKECTIHFRQCISHEREWEKIQQEPEVYKKLLTASSDKKFVTKIFHLLDGEGIGIKEIYAVYCPMLVSALGLTKEKFTSRAVKSADVFLKEKWRDLEESERRRAKREWTKSYLTKKINLFSWNSFDPVPVLATIHGTAGAAAWKICCGGFAALSSLDSGYYSAGIYFTTSAKYAVPYFATKSEPAIIISWVIVGNAYPVIEHPRKSDSLAGTIIKPGYQSHYVCTDNKGMPYPKITPDYKNVYDEIVINQESQVAPAYVLMLDSATFPKLIVEFNRKTAVPKGEMSASSGEDVDNMEDRQADESS